MRREQDLSLSASRLQKRMLAFCLIVILIITYFLLVGTDFNPERLLNKT